MIKQLLNRVGTATRHALVVPIMLASYGLIDLLRSVPGPPIKLVLPLRETGHADSVSLYVLVGVWLTAFAVAAFVAPTQRSWPWLAGGRTLLSLVVLIPAQALMVELVRQGSIGFDWAAAARSPSVGIAAVCALVATAACSRPWPHADPLNLVDRHDESLNDAPARA